MLAGGDLVGDGALLVGGVVVADDAGELPAGGGVVPEHGEFGVAGGDFGVVGVGEAVGADFERAVGVEAVNFERAGDEGALGFAADIVFDGGEEDFPAGCEAGLVVVELQVSGDEVAEGGEVAGVVGGEELAVEIGDGAGEGVGCVGDGGGGMPGGVGADCVHDDAGTGSAEDASGGAAQVVALEREAELDGDGGVDRYREDDGAAGEGGLRGGREVGGVVAGGAGGGVGRVEGEIELVGVDTAVGVDGIEGAGPVTGEGGGGLGVGGEGGAEQEECQGGEVGEDAVGH